MIHAVADLNWAGSQNLLWIEAAWRTVAGQAGSMGPVGQLSHHQLVLLRYVSPGEAPRETTQHGGGEQDFVKQRRYHAVAHQHPVIDAAAPATASATTTSSVSWAFAVSRQHVRCSSIRTLWTSAAHSRECEVTE